MLNSGVSIFTLNPFPKVLDRSPPAAATGATRRGGATATGATLRGGATTAVVDELVVEMALWTALLI